MKKILLLILALSWSLCFGQTTAPYHIYNLTVDNALVGTLPNPALNYLSSLANATPRTYSQKLSDFTSINDFTSIAAAASSGKSIYIPAGSYSLTSNVAFVGAVQFQTGAVFNIATGVTVTFNGTIFAPRSQIFATTGTGNVVISGAGTTMGFPEWWGAQTGVTGTDQAPFINQCIVALVVCKLAAGTYYTTGTILQQTQNRAVVGASPEFVGTGGSTIISNNSPTATMYQIGPNTYTGASQNTNILKNVFILRSVAPTISAVTNGVLIQFTTWTSVDNVASQDSAFGFHIQGNWNMFMFKDTALRSLAGTGGGTDKFYGFWADGSTNIGAAGGNASLILRDCSVGNTITWTSALDYQGFVATGTYGYSDIFLDYFSTANLGFGIDLVGNGNTSTTFDNQNEDVRIYNPVLDSNGFAGINFNNTSLYGSIQVIGGYINFNPAGSVPVGIQYTNSNGSITTMGVEIMCQQSTSAVAISATSSKGIDQIGNDYFECKHSAPLTLNAVTNSRFEDRIRAYSLGSTAAPAIWITNNSSRLKMNMSVEGASSAYSQGYYLGDATTSYSEFNATGINATAIGGSGSNYKLNNNGAQISTQGTFGTTNYASGILN